VRFANTFAPASLQKNAQSRAFEIPWSLFIANLWIADNLGVDDEKPVSRYRSDSRDTGANRKWFLPHVIPTGHLRSTSPSRSAPRSCRALWQRGHRRSCWGNPPSHRG
jgi:hypothetical protein